MEIIEMIRYFRKKNIYQWNHWVKETTGNEMTRKERDRILNVMEAYYETVFRKEEMILRPYLIRVIQNEKRKCQAEGLWNWIGKIHTRLQVEETEIIYLKNHEFKYKKKELNTVFLTVSTFVYPHLWLFKHRQELEVVKGVIVESIESDIPEDLVQIFKVLGDKTRLRIIKLMSESELYDAALKNTKSFMKPRMIRMRAFGMCAPMDNEAYCVMGNNSAKNCAALIADPEYLQEIAEMIGTDYYIVPLGIEGFVVVPEAYCDVDMQKDALKGTNEASQKDTLFLSNDLYFYGSETGELSVVQ